jgi:hypothetical protein
VQRNLNDLPHESLPGGVPGETIAALLGREAGRRSGCCDDGVLDRSPPASAR